MRAGFLETLATKQADAMKFNTPRDVIAPTDLLPLQGLKEDGICVVQSEQLSFRHDLLADWARQRILLGRLSHGLTQFLDEKMVSPLWNKAVRLLGLHLLESNDLEEWNRRLTDFGTLTSGAKLTQDLMTEAVIFAANPSPILNKLWEYLKLNSGELLRRFLNRFLHVATLPNPVLSVLAAILDPNVFLESTTLSRLPHQYYWPAIVTFLHTRMEDVLRWHRRRSLNYATAG